MIRAAPVGNIYFVPDEPLNYATPVKAKSTSPRAIIISTLVGLGIAIFIGYLAVIALYSFR